MASNLTFSLKDRDGVEHLYTVTPHSPLEDGMDVLTVLLQLGAGPAAQAFFAAARVSEEERLQAEAAVKAGGEPDPSAGQIRWGDVFDNIDLPAAVESFQAGLVQSGGMKRLAPLVLKHTFRDGTRLFDARTGKALGFDSAYGMNYGEMVAAVREVERINGFFASLAGFGFGA